MVGFSKGATGDFDKSDSLNIDIMARIVKYNRVKPRDVITHPCPLSTAVQLNYS